jgi:adenosylcobyric acid synthase
MPFLPRLGLPEEDSVALETASPAARGGMRVVVVRLPHIANFTDFAPLEAEPGVDLVYAEEPGALPGAALVVLPGSKDTIGDLRALKARGFAAALAAHRARGGFVLGVCGGYQMLGRVVADPYGVESGGEETALGWLPVWTTLAREKITRRVRARWRPDGPDFEGYEIHAGVIAGDAPARPLLDVEGEAEGCASADGRVWGTHLHGLFESGPARRHVLEWARGAPALAEAPAPLDHRARREAAYDRLADALAAALDPSVLRALGVS